MLKVRISEMQRQIAKQFGVNLAGVDIDRRHRRSRSATSNPYGSAGPGA